MYQLTCNIEIIGIQKWRFNYISEIEIHKDIDKLTDTCTLKLPRNIKWKGYDSIPLKRGDQIKIELGYDGQNQLAFEGYITTIGLKTPIEITCEDSMFLLKQQTAIKKAYKKGNIKTILSDQNIAIPINVIGDQNIGKYRANFDTISALLNDLSKKGIRSFIKYGELYSGIIFDEPLKRTQVYNNKINIIDDKDLKIQNAKDIKLRIKAVSLDANNTKTEVEVGDSDGEVRTIHSFNQNPKELKEWAEKQLARLKVDGLTGSFETFGSYICEKLDVIGIIIDSKKQGEYQIKSNVITFGKNGFRQKIKLGTKV